MTSSTSSTGINVRTVCLFVSAPAHVAPSGLRAGVVGLAQVLAANPDYPTTAMIEYLTRQVIAAILFNEPDSGFGEPLN